MSAFLAAWAKGAGSRESLSLRRETERATGSTARGHSGELPELTQDQAAAVALCNLAGVRLWREGSQTICGIWSDLRGPELEQALVGAGLGGLPIRFLDGDGIPEGRGFRIRRCPERARGESWASWRARALMSRGGKGRDWQ